MSQINLRTNCLVGFTMDSLDPVMHQSVFGGEIDKLFPIVTKDATSCPNPQNTILNKMAVLDKVSHQSIIRGESSECLFISKEIFVPKPLPF
ncbi:MAG: hypothetical protein H8D67_05100 [Deltaproteobacteria bacterium]|nr:hypothetical protein [Deltaproteobacteria bacterium]